MVIVPAHNEEDVIARRVENLLALDYPAEQLEVVVASDASDDRTDEIVEEIAAHEPPSASCARPRGEARRARPRRAGTDAEVVAFSDANSSWEPDALRKLVRNFADPDVGYVCGRLRLEQADGTNREGLYWRYELWQREQESALGSITGGNGSIYAVRRSDYVEYPLGHDLGFPYLFSAGRRAVYEPEALAFEKPSRDNEEEYRRKVRMFLWCWRTVFEGRMLSGVPPLYALELVSHRLLRYASGLLHLELLASSVVLAREGGIYRWRSPASSPCSASRPPAVCGCLCRARRSPTTTRS